MIETEKRRSRPASFEKLAGRRFFCVSWWMGVYIVSDMDERIKIEIGEKRRRKAGKKENIKKERKRKKRKVKKER